MTRFTLAICTLVLSACSGTKVDQLSVRTGLDAAKIARDASPDDLKVGEASSGLGDVRLRPEICQGTDLKPEQQLLSAGAVVEFLSQQGLESKIEREREDLVYVELAFPDGSVRLRVATLPSPHEAGRELHDAVLQHGRGSWGVHRSNIAVLGPIGSLDDILTFNAKTKLGCWGILTVAGLDDSFVVPGGYQEL